MAELVVAGAGPQALTLCCLLLQKRPQWRRRLRILDPSGRWLSRWHQQMQRCEISWLRSPSPHHPHPNAHALRRFADETRRYHELKEPYGRPHTGLFNSFCQHVVEEFGLKDRVQAAYVREITPGLSSHDPVQLRLSDGSQLPARCLVVATGAGAPVLPEWVKQIPRAYPPFALQHSQDLDLMRCGELHGRTVLIVGGGLSSAHLGLGAIQRGARVILLCRRALRCKLFDADPGWLGPKHLKAFHREPCWRQRRKQVLQARDGGSITPELAHALQRERDRGGLELLEHCEVLNARWHDGQWRCLCNNARHLQVDRLWLATGHRLGVSHHPLLHQLQTQKPIELIDDWPVLSDSLRWPGTPVHVMGALTALRIGPAARNLFGGREAAQRICRGLLKT